jgi:endonuclease/exonuclease/phosphatase family metal-dependent hydrolase
MMTQEAEQFTPKEEHSRNRNLSSSTTLLFSKEIIVVVPHKIDVTKSPTIFTQHLMLFSLQHRWIRLFLLLSTLFFCVHHLIPSSSFRLIPPGALSEGIMEENQGKPTSPVSVLTYNIHSCVGSDGEYSVNRIADVVRQANADIVCLQEVEVNTELQTTRTWSKPHKDDQVALIAEQAGYQYYKFAPAVTSIANTVAGTEVFDDDSGGKFGVALLSKWPIADHKIVTFTPYQKKTPRNVLACHIEMPASQTLTKENKTIWVLSTHLGCHFRGREQLHQARELRLLVENLLSEANKTSTVILAGDFNSVNWYASVKMIRDVLIEANRHNEGTFPAVGRLLRPGSFKLDYIFHSPDVICKDTSVQLKGAVASDHLAMGALLLI